MRPLIRPRALDSKQQRELRVVRCHDPRGRLRESDASMLAVPSDAAIGKRLSPSTGVGTSSYLQLIC